MRTRAAPASSEYWNSSRARTPREPQARADGLGGTRASGIEGTRALGTSLGGFGVCASRLRIRRGENGLG
eukprot:10135846-Alexandrium_andersonii.AAC.1